MGAAYPYLFSSPASYSYTVGEKIYDGGQCIFTDDLVARGSVDKAKATIGQYSVGQVVPAYYNPENPVIAVLEPGNAGIAGGTLTGGIPILLLGIRVVWMAIISIIK